MTGLSSNGVALLAYLRHAADPEGREVHPASWGPGNAKAVVGHEKAEVDEGDEGEEGGREGNQGRERD